MTTLNIVQIQSKLELETSTSQSCFSQRNRFGLDNYRVAAIKLDVAPVCVMDDILTS